MKKIVNVYYILEEKDIKNIKKQLFNKGLTYKELAEKIGVTTGYVSGIMLGHKHFTEKVRKQFKEQGIVLKGRK